MDGRESWTRIAKVSKEADACSVYGSERRDGVTVKGRHTAACQQEGQEAECVLETRC